jgi:hypothetical protein
MYLLQALAFSILTQVVLAEQPTPILPDPKLTPGDTFDVTAQDVCVPGYAKKVRAVPAWLKRQAYAEYGITQYKTGDYEVDHLIPLSLGGSNSIRNLWPQSTTTGSEVWVNTRSGKYWKPGSRYYGKTKEGEFMSELEALDRGYAPAGGTGQ